ncbi:MAG: hypothetical protein KGI51_13415 [Rhodospirillales bacterium]|nr:hypothetical protein [Rhodospirillales bacterium]
MGCFCHATIGALGGFAVNLQASLAAGASVSLPGANVALGLGAWLAELNLPAAPWTPNFAPMPLPQLRMSVQAATTVAALAQLRAQVLAQFGLDLMNPAQARAFARVAATLAARLSVMAGMPGMGALPPLPWIRLAATLTAIENVQAAISAGLLVPNLNLTPFTMPGGIPMPNWAGFLAELRALLPMISACLNLNLAVTETAQLSAAIGVLARVALPSLPSASLQLMATLSASLTAIASLGVGLGIDPLAAGYAAVAAEVQVRLNAMLRLVAGQFSITLRGMSPEALLTMLLSLLPKIPFQPGSLAASESVRLAMSASALAALNWSVPVSVNVTAVGLPACHFAAQIKAALGVSAVLAGPCGSGCDAARLLAAA